MITSRSKKEVVTNSMENDGKPIGASYSSRIASPAKMVPFIEKIKPVAKPKYVQRTSVTVKSVKAPPVVK